MQRWVRPAGGKSGTKPKPLTTYFWRRRGSEELEWGVQSPVSYGFRIGGLQGGYAGKISEQMPLKFWYHLCNREESALMKNQPQEAADPAPQRTRGPSLTFVRCCVANELVWVKWSVPRHESAAWASGRWPVWRGDCIWGSKAGAFQSLPSSCYAVALWAWSLPEEIVILWTLYFPGNNLRENFILLNVNV